MERRSLALGCRSALPPLVAMAVAWYACSPSPGGGENQAAALARWSFWLAAEASKRYMEVLEDWPVATKALTTGVIQLMGDGMAQWFEQRGERAETKTETKTETPGNRRRYDSRRGASLFAEGLLLSGPLLHYCYESMEEAWPTSTVDAAPRPLATLCHVFVNDYFIDSAYIAFSIAFTAIGEGHTMGEVGEIFSKDYWDTLKASWATSACLLPLEIYCFGFLSLSLRVLAMNFVDLLWGAVVSFYSHRSRREAAG